MTSFADLGVRGPLVAALARQGITEPFPIQECTLHDALAGRDVCGEAKTGSGKTIAFAIPMVQRTPDGGAGAGRSASPTGLVLVPTRELACQVEDVFRPLAAAAKLKVLALYGGAPLEKQITRLQRGVDIVVATPGRLIDLLQRNAVAIDAVTTLVVDEADRMADLGFLNQVEWILARLGKGPRQSMLFSATLDNDVEVLVRRHLTDPVRHSVVPEGKLVEEMSHRFLAVHIMDRVRVVAAIARNADRTIGFVRTKRGADRLVKALCEEGVRAEAIHGDLRQSARERALKNLAAGTLDILVATDVAARGIHIDDVDVVLHFDPPEDYKSYLHRSGRTARAGRQGVVATFVLWDQVKDVDRLKRHLRLTEPTVQIFSNDPRLEDLAAWDETPAPVASRA